MEWIHISKACDADLVWHSSSYRDMISQNIGVNNCMLVTS